MSEKGCLLSKRFNTLSISNKIETKDLFTKNHTKAAFHITRDTAGEIMIDQKDIFNLDSVGEKLPASNALPAVAADKIITFPPKSIIESISIILKNDNYHVKENVDGQHGGNLAAKFQIIDENGAKDFFVDNTSSPNIILLPGDPGPGSGVSDTGSFVSINTIIPILSNYRFNSKLDKVKAVSIAGFVDEKSGYLIDPVHLDKDETGTSAIPHGVLYNDSESSKQISVQIFTMNAPTPGAELLGFADFDSEGNDRATTGIYSNIRANNVPTEGQQSTSEVYGGAFSALVTFTKLL